MDKSERLMVNAAGVAEMLSCSRSHVYALQNSGRLPKPCKLGKSTRWPVKVLREWVESGCPSR